MALYINTTEKCHLWVHIHYMRAFHKGFHVVNSSQRCSIFAVSRRFYSFSFVHTEIVLLTYQQTNNTNTYKQHWLNKNTNAREIHASPTCQNHTFYRNSISNMYKHKSRELEIKLHTSHSTNIWSIYAIPFVLCN